MSSQQKINSLVRVLKVQASALECNQKPKEMLEVLNEIDATKNRIAQEIYNTSPEESYDLLVEYGVAKPRGRDE